jgi:hypothetical protein
MMQMVHLRIITWFNSLRRHWRPAKGKQTIEPAAPEAALDRSQFEPAFTVFTIQFGRPIALFTVFLIQSSQVEVDYQDEQHVH